MLIVGVGNRMRGDDAAGPLVAERLAAHGFETRVIEADGAHLIEAFEGRDAVVVIDAMRSGAEPGTVCRFEAEADTLPADLFHYSSHAFGVAEAIETARALDFLPASVMVYGIEGAQFTAGAEPSPEVAKAIDEVVAEIVASREPD
ncbi:MAG: hydrogenase maturation protease [Hyphomicrobiales bacterium]|nr:MAG: hydrogenase maturation protease [Hyphomicrobiales bacterium]